MSRTPFILSRRDTLAMLAVTAGLGFTEGLNARTSSPSLADLAAAKGMRFGSAVSAVAGGIANPAVASLLIRECNLIVPENELKMYITHNAPDSYHFEPGDRILAFCKAHHMAMRGHNLIWARDQYTPEWLKSYDFGSNPKVEAERLFREYIVRMIEHYDGRLTSWDVVNEVIDEKTGELREGVYTRYLGMDVLRIAFEQTRELLPKTQLVYNDFMCWYADNDKHRAGVLKLLRWFRDNKIPVDALGVQAHLGVVTDPANVQAEEWKKFLDEVVSMDYGLLITELDVNDKKIESSDFAERDAAVAKVTREFLDQMLDYKQLKDVLVWGICDKYNWLRSIVHRKDGLPVRPTLYDENFQPKPMREAIAAAFKAASKR